MKNGSHCAFAHGAHDLRPPIYDVRELQAIDTVTINCDKSSNASSVSGTPSSLEKDKILAEDPRWNGKFIYNCKLEVKACYIISVLAGIFSCVPGYNLALNVSEKIVHEIWLAHVLKQWNK